jgi:hypothetical protein
LRTVGLAVDRLQLVVLVERVALGPFDDRMLVGTTGAFPDPGERRERSQVRERVGVAVGLGVDVGLVRLCALMRRVSSDPRGPVNRVAAARRALFGKQLFTRSSQTPVWKARLRSPA